MRQISSSNQNSKSTEPVITYAILGLVALVTIGTPFFQSKYIYPLFIELIIEITESEAVRIGRNMMRVGLQDYSDGTLVISEDTRAYLDKTSKDYDLWKVNIFSKSGETIYSTAKNNIGQLNKNPYFHEIVAKGKVYTKVVHKDSKSLENKVVTSDVVETYIPVMEKGKFVGAFELYYNISPRKAAMDAIVAQTNLLLYSLTTIILLVILGGAVLLHRKIIERKRFENTLYTLASRDALTGIYNRRRLIEILQWEVEKQSRNQKNSCLLMFDIDHFKNVNDNYGHQAGDDVLVAVAEACQQVIRKSDLIARYGGEEFIVLLPATEQAGAVELAEKLRQTVAELRTPCVRGEIRVTVSIGVVDFSKIPELSFDTAIKFADDCLYRAKKSGRNKVCAND